MGTVNASLYSTHVWYLRFTRRAMRNGDFSDTHSFWLIALHYPAAMRQIDLKYDDLIWAARGYAASVAVQAAQGNFTGALGLRTFVNDRELPISWSQIGLSEDTVCLWIEKGTHQLFKVHAHDHNHALKLLHMLYYYPETRKILGDRNVDNVIAVIVRWARQIYNELQKPDLPSDEDISRSLELMCFLAVQRYRESRYKDRLRLNLSGLCGFTWEDVYQRHKFWKTTK